MCPSSGASSGAMVRPPTLVLAPTQHLQHPPHRTSRRQQSVTLIKLALPSPCTSRLWVCGCSPSRGWVLALGVCSGTRPTLAVATALPCWEEGWPPGTPPRQGDTQPGTGSGHWMHWGCLTPDWDLSPLPSSIAPHLARDAPSPSPGHLLLPGAPRHLGPSSPLSSHTELHPAHCGGAGISLPAWQSCSGFRMRCRHVGTPPLNHSPSSPQGETKQNFNFNVH